MGKKIFVIILTALLCTPILFAQSSGKHQHDGLFLRFLLGGSYSSMSIDGGPMEMELSGMSGTFRFQIGGTVAKNLVIFGELGGVTLTNPDIKIDGKSYELDGVKASSFDFGGGITYYFMPSNFYLTASILASRADFEFSQGSNTVKGESDMGFGFFAGVGKEWWIAENWALGATLFTAYSSVPDQDPSDATISNLTFGVAFSATFH